MHVSVSGLTKPSAMRMRSFPLKAVAGSSKQVSSCDESASAAHHRAKAEVVCPKGSEHTGRLRGWEAIYCGTHDVNPYPFFGCFIFLMCVVGQPSGEMINRETRYKAVVHYKYFLHSIRKVARLYNVSKSSLQRWINLDPSALQHRRPNRRTLKLSILTCISNTLQQNPFSNMQHVAQCVQQECGLMRSPRTMTRYVRGGGWTRKKCHTTINRGHPAKLITEFCTQYQEHEQGLICIDEAGFHVGDHNRFGYAKRGSRLNVKAARTLRQRKYTLIMAINAAGIVHYEVLDHNCRKTDFIAFVKAIQAPAGSTLLMDNIAFHHSRETKTSVTEKGFNQLFIPSYSPRFNAIEYVFGRLKPLYRSMCPPNSDPSFNYKGAFVSILNQPQSFHAFFGHVSRSVEETRLNPHNVQGYDL